MPLTPLQRLMAQELLPFRSESSFIGGGAALNRAWPRLSDDLDIFADRSDLPFSALTELAALRAAGFAVDIVVQSEWTVEAIVKRYGEETRIQWLDDEETSRRFFKAIADERLGFRLHQADNAVNKVLCAVRRLAAPRDAIDLVTIVTDYAPLSPLVWAACGKDANLNPNKVIAGIRKNIFGYADVELHAVRMADDTHFTQREVRAVLAPALEQAAAYCEREAPEDRFGCLFVDEREIPIMASAQDLNQGRARSIPIKQFRATPQFP